MLILPVSKRQLRELTGDDVAVMINRHWTVAALAGWVTYTDVDGKENRCRLLHWEEDGDTIRFICASHGEENEPHFIIAADDAQNLKE